ncbi:hypothetical protein Pmani_012500 [Petrolisthes manimaculis]|uniref:SCAN box domain-containing protein n=1 Tax=Petrolisthes manimaculis TaxID=1843537 RepID=A0AAE1UD64_9EUCA|nr:hypothetical protein Pmani_012500 [Petrolisthes manimaculis]
MSRSNIRDLHDEGSQLGYSGEELQKWVREEWQGIQAAERESRAAERELSKLKLEAEIEASKAAAAASAAAAGTTVQSVTSVVNPPKIPAFDESKDEIDTYISRFERVAEGAGWSRAIWPTALASFLTGRALEMYHMFTDDVVLDFSKFKAALLKEYDVTSEGYRTRFRTSRFREGESAQQFICRLRKYVCKWVEADGCEQTYKALLDLIVREQFINMCPSSLTIYLKERHVCDANECAEETDRWIDAHGHPASTTKMKPARKIDGEERAESIRPQARPCSVKDEKLRKPDTVEDQKVTAMLDSDMTEFADC